MKVNINGVWKEEINNKSDLELLLKDFKELPFNVSDTIPYHIGWGSDIINKNSSWIYEFYIINNKNISTHFTATFTTGINISIDLLDGTHLPDGFNIFSNISQVFAYNYNFIYIDMIYTMNYDWPSENIINKNIFTGVMSKLFLQYSKIITKLLNYKVFYKKIN